MKTWIVNDENCANFSFNNETEFAEYIEKINEMFINNVSWCIYTSYDWIEMNNLIHEKHSPARYVKDISGLPSPSANSGRYAEIISTVEILKSHNAFPIGFIQDIPNKQVPGLDLMGYIPDKDIFLIGESKNYDSNKFTTALKSSYQSLFERADPIPIAANFLKAKKDYKIISSLVKKPISQMASITLESLANEINESEDEKKEPLSFWISKMREKFYLSISIFRNNLNLINSEIKEKSIQQIEEYFQNKDKPNEICLFLTSWNSQKFYDVYKKELMSNEYWQKKWNRKNKEIFDGQSIESLWK